MAPECGPWSVSSSSKKPEDRQADRLRDGPSIRWVQDTCEDQSRHGRGYAVEQPLGSAMWRPEDGSPLYTWTPLKTTARSNELINACMALRMRMATRYRKLPVWVATSSSPPQPSDAMVTMVANMLIFEDKPQMDSIAQQRQQSIRGLCVRGSAWMWWPFYTSGSCSPSKSGLKP